MYPWHIATHRFLIVDQVLLICFPLMDPLNVWNVESLCVMHTKFDQNWPRPFRGFENVKILQQTYDGKIWYNLQMFVDDPHLTIIHSIHLSRAWTKTYDLCAKVIISLRVVIGCRKSWCKQNCDKITLNLIKFDVLMQNNLYICSIFINTSIATSLDVQS